MPIDRRATFPLALGLPWASSGTISDAARRPASAYATGGSFVPV
jgi:hypothetical protein